MEGVAEAARRMLRDEVVARGMVEGEPESGEAVWIIAAVPGGRVSLACSCMHMYVCTYI